LDARAALTIREYRPGDEERILATFNRVFAEIDPGFQPRDLVTWRWQFLENPSGWRIFVAEDESAAIVSQYAGIGQRVFLEGAPARFSQSVDSMTDPARRAGLGKRGAFVLTGEPYAAAYGGPPPTQDTVMWGLPVPTAWRIGRRYLGYSLVRTQLELFAAPGELVLGAAAGVEVEEVARFPDEVDGLSGRLGRERGAVAVRDAAQLDWRFVRKPGCDYRIGLARRAGELVGCAVCLAGSFDQRPGLLVCDWIVPAGERAAASALTAWLGEVAVAEGQREVRAIFPETAPEWLAFQERGFRARGTRYVLAGRTYAKRTSMAWLRRNWYYTLGDTDLV